MAEKFVTKSEEVEAVQFLDDASATEIQNMVGTCRFFFQDESVWAIDVWTANGSEMAAKHDWVGKVLSTGAVFVLRPEKFEETFEAKQ